ncbi:hypothetical protein LVJ94_18055 [Pendulispora rubella]|uniref:Protein kinase domain-containing protein n=1 Tax=Pendulispora rubella TaxID=2741070 RepID=A0ABZ2LEC1_9BACT
MVRFLGTEEGVHAGPDATGVESYIVRAEAAGDAAPRLILERVLRSQVTAEDFDAFTRRARRIAMLRHPNVPRVRDVFTTAEHAVVVTEFIDGKRWGSLDGRAESQRKASLSLEVRLKLLLDSISALAALHALREPGWSSTSTGAKVPSMIHGDVTPSSILVGTDGVARLLRIHRIPLHPPGGPLGERTARCAPEILLGDGTADGRADVYSIGVMLWEALSGKRLFTQPTVAEMLSRQLAGDLPAATTSVAWAEPLVDVAAAALAVDPKRRYATAIDLGMAIRNVVGHRVAGASEVARQVAGILGNVSGARKVVMPPPPPVPPPRPTTPASLEIEDEPEEDVELEEDLAEFLEPVAAAPVVSAAPELEAIDERWSSLAPAPAIPASPPAGPPPLQVGGAMPPPPVPAPAPTPVTLVGTPPPLLHAPLRMTPAPMPPMPPVAPSANTLRPSDITELQARSPRRKRQILIVMFLAALLLFVTVCTTTLLLRSPKTTATLRAATSSKPVESAAAPKALAVATPAAPEPAPIPTPDPTPAAPPPVTASAPPPAPPPSPSPPARAVAPASVPGRRPAATVPSTAPAPAPAKVNATPAPKAAAAPKSSPPPPPAARAPAKPRPKRSTYVPLGI